MKIYLRKFYGEVVAGSGVKQTQWEDEEHPERCFIEGTEKEKEVLRKLNMLEGMEPPDEAPPEDGAEVTENQEPDAKKGDTLKDAPASYLCKRHKIRHQKGSSAYFECFSKNVKK